MISQKLGRFLDFDPDVRPPVTKSHREEIGLVIIFQMGKYLAQLIGSMEGSNICKALLSATYSFPGIVSRRMSVHPSQKVCYKNSLLRNDKRHI